MNEEEKKKEEDEENDRKEIVNFTYSFELLIFSPFVVTLNVSSYVSKQEKITFLARSFA